MGFVEGGGGFVVHSLPVHRESESRPKLRLKQSIELSHVMQLLILNFGMASVSLTEKVLKG